MDHLGGLLWLLRSRIGDLPPCRLYGPPGLAGHIDGLIRGFLWDRVGGHGPVFDVGELHGDRLEWTRLQAGGPRPETFETTSVVDGVLLSEPGFCVRAVALDHHTTVLAFAFEPDREINVRKDRLLGLALEPGPWLNDLKQRVISDDTAGSLVLPDGRETEVADLAHQLLMISPGKRLVYATDLADTMENRGRLVGLARYAHTLFLEAVFTEADAEHGRTHGHLTARACGEIATSAGVSHLVPFHLSRRYANDPLAVFDEIEAACGCVVRPGPEALAPSADEEGQREPALGVD
jgi:ribonuclease BN (tRNA processing enzyme)